MCDYKKFILSDSESEDEPLIPEPKLQKPKRQYKRKPMSDEANKAFKERECLKHEHQKRKGYHLNLLKKKK